MLFSKDFLDKKRKVGDLKADRLIADIFGKGEQVVLRNSMGLLNKNEDIYSEKLPENIRRYFEENASLPDWANETLLAKGAEFFKKNGQNILSLLGFYSLPYCYAAADGAKVLYLSEQIRKNTYQRLQETAQYVIQVTEPGAFYEPKGAGIVSSLKVRLMHAATRYYILKSKDWDMSWGTPVNQEDMAGTNLSFSLLVIRGLLKMRCKVSTEETEAYLHLWNVAGYLLGLEDAMLCHQYKEAFWLEKRIRTRHFRYSEEGKILTEKLIDTMQVQMAERGLPKQLASSYMRFLMGNEISDMLGIPPVNWTIALVKSFQAINLFQDLTERQKTNKDFENEIKKQFDMFSSPFLVPLKLGV